MEWKKLTSEDYMSHEYIIQINAELARVRGQVMEAFDAILPTFVVPITGGEAMPVMRQDINVIERGIATMASVVRPQGLKPTRNWQGEDLDDPLLDYNDVNRWFESLALIREVLETRD